MLRPGDIVKSQETKKHAVVGAISDDGFVFYGYTIQDRSEIRWSVKGVDLVYSTEEEIHADGS